MLVCIDFLFIAWRFAQKKEIFQGATIETNRTLCGFAVRSAAFKPWPVVFVSVRSATGRICSLVEPPVRYRLTPVGFNGSLEVDVCSAPILLLHRGSVESDLRCPECELTIS